MASVELKGIGKIYDGGVRAVEDVNLVIEDGEFVVLVGPSGCGKSTTLRMVAGLEDITEGDLSIDGNRVNEVAARDRDIAMVFQNYALYPHLDVRSNLSFGLERRRNKLGLSRDDIAKKVEATAANLGIENLLGRLPKQLSGGRLKVVWASDRGDFRSQGSQRWLPPSWQCHLDSDQAYSGDAQVRTRGSNEHQDGDTRRSSGRPSQYHDPVPPPH